MGGGGAGRQLYAVQQCVCVAVEGMLKGMNFPQLNALSVKIHLKQVSHLASVLQTFEMSEKT